MTTGPRTEFRVSFIFDVLPQEDRTILLNAVQRLREARLRRGTRMASDLIQLEEALQAMPVASVEPNHAMLETRPVAALIGTENAEPRNGGQRGPNRDELLRILAEHDGNVRATAGVLGCSEQALRNRMSLLGIRREVKWA